MPTKLSRYKQTIFDIVCENFGSLDNLIDFIKDNRRSITQNLSVNTSFIVNSDGLGDSYVKRTILNQGLEFNNNYVSLNTVTWDSTLITFDSTLITFDQT